LTGQNDIWRYAAGAEICPDIAGLRAAAFIKVALCRAIINPEMSRVTGAGGQRVPHEQNIGIDGVNCRANRVCSGRGDAEQNDQQKDCRVRQSPD
jgi:hypothetical protein